MARKAIVDRPAVLEMLKEGKTSQAIADRFGVSRQAIDLYRKQFTREGLLQPARVTQVEAVDGAQPDRVVLSHAHHIPSAPPFLHPPSPL